MIGSNTSLLRLTFYSSDISLGYCLFECEGSLSVNQHFPAG